MSLESFRELCNKGKFYFFDTPQHFNDRIDYNGIKLKGVKFERGIIDEGVDNVPTRYSAYGVKIYN